MQRIGDAFHGVIPVLSLFFIGYLLKTAGFFEAKSVQDIKKLVVYLTLPCLLFLAFSQVRLNLDLMAVFVSVFLACLVMTFYGKFVRKAFAVKTRYFTPMMVGYETGMVGYAIFIAAYGMEAVETFAAVDLGQLLYVWVVLIGPLVAMREGSRRSGRVLRMAVTSPVVISIVAGLAAGTLQRKLAFAGSAPYGEFLGLVSLIADLTMPLICIAIGYELTVKADTFRLTTLTILLRIVPQACLALFINRLVFVRLLNLDVEYQRALLVMFLLPPPFVYTLFIKSDDAENQRYVSSTLSLYTVLSVILFVFTSSLYG